MVMALNSTKGRMLAMPANNAYRSPGVFEGYQGAGGTAPAATASPALAAMKQTGMTNNVAPRSPFAAAQGNGSAASNSAPFSAATVDTSAATAANQAGIDANQKLIDQQRGFGENFMQSLQRRNGSNAALTGMSAGGGSYLAGQRAAFTQGINALNQSLLPFAQQQNQFYANNANILSGAAQTNAGNRQGAMDKNAQYGIDQNRAGDDAKSGYYANQVARLDEQVKTQSNIGGDDNKGPRRAEYMNYRSQYDKAVSEGNWAEADRLYAAMNAMINWG